MDTKVRFPGSDILGLHRTEAGRETIRLIFPEFLAKAGFGLSRVADLLVERMPARIGRSKSSNTPEDLRAEALRKAIARWVSGEQPSIYRSKERNERYIAAIEHEMMQVSAIRLTLERQLSAEHERAAGEAFAAFIYSANEAYDTATASLRQRLHGLFQLTGTAADLAPGNIMTDVPFETGTYVYFDDTGDAFLTCHLFDLKVAAGRLASSYDGLEGLRNLRSGHAFPRPDGSVQYVYSEKAPPERKYIAVWAPATHPEEAIPTDLQFDFTAMRPLELPQLSVLETATLFPGNTIGFCRVDASLEQAILRLLRTYTSHDIK